MWHYKFVLHFGENYEYWSGGFPTAHAMDMELDIWRKEYDLTLIRKDGAIYYYDAKGRNAE